MSCTEIEMSEWVKLFASVISPIAVASIAAFLAYQYGKKKLKEETAITLGREKYKRRLDAIQQCWMLLQYSTDVENSKSVLTFIKDKQSNERIYFLNISNGKKYIESLSDYFYGTGLGLYLPKEIKPILFEYRNVVYGILLASRNDTAESVTIKKEVAESMIKLHINLIRVLRKEVDEAELSVQSGELPESG